MARQIVVELVGDNTNLNRSLQGAISQTGKFDSVLKGIGAGIGFTGFGMVANAVSTATQYIGDSISKASDLNETISKTGQIFGREAVPGLEAWAAKASETFGQSKQQALDAASTFAIFGKSAGLSGDRLMGFSKELTVLASDLASFNNSSPEEAITAIGAALRGEAEPMRRFGVLLDDATLRNRALKMGLVQTTKQALTPQQKVLAAHAEILEQTSDAQGDFARTADGAANKQRTLQAKTEDQQAALGQKLLPIWEKVLNLFEKVGIPVLGFLADVIGLLVKPIELVVDAISTLADVAGGVFDNFAMDFGDMGDRIHEIADATGQDFQTVKDSIKKSMEESGLSFEEAAEKAEKEFGSIPDAMESAMDDGIREFKQGQRQIADEARRGGETAAQEAISPIRALRAKYREEAFQSKVEYARGLRDGRDQVKVQMELLKDDLNKSMTRTQEIAYLKGELTGKALKQGLNSADPIVRAQAEATRAAIINRLATLEGSAKGLGYGAGVAFGDAIATGINQSRWTAQQAAAGLAGVIRAQFPGSEPKDSSSPLRGVTGAWGMVDVIADGIKKRKGVLPRALKEAIGGPVQAPALIGDIAGKSSRVPVPAMASAMPAGRNVTVNVNIESFVGSDRDIDKFADRLAMRLRLQGVGV